MTERPTLTHTAPILASSDIVRTVGFYRERLGFSAVYVNLGTWGIVARDGVQIHFWPCTIATSPRTRRVASTSAE